MNVPKLKGIIAERGYSMREVAAAINMKEKTFYNKMKKGVFGTDEAEALISFLNITNPADIFLRSK